MGVARGLNRCDYSVTIVHRYWHPCRREGMHSGTAVVLENLSTLARNSIDYVSRIDPSWTDRTLVSRVHVQAGRWPPFGPYLSYLWCRQQFDTGSTHQSARICHHLPSVSQSQQPQSSATVRRLDVAHSDRNLPSTLSY